VGRLIGIFSEKEFIRKPSMYKGIARTKTSKKEIRKPV
jgi:hypothetical protein